MMFRRGFFLFLRQPSRKSTLDCRIPDPCRCHRPTHGQRDCHYVYELLHCPEPVGGFKGEVLEGYSRYRRTYN